MSECYTNMLINMFTMSSSYSGERGNWLRYRSHSIKVALSTSFGVQSTTKGVTHCAVSRGLSKLCLFCSLELPARLVTSPRALLACPPRVQRVLLSIVRVSKLLPEQAGRVLWGELWWQPAVGGATATGHSSTSTLINRTGRESTFNIPWWGVWIRGMMGVNERYDWWDGSDCWLVTGCSVSERM